MRRLYTLLTFFVLVMNGYQLNAQVRATSPADDHVRIFIPFAIHSPARAVDGSVAKGLDGYGNIVDEVVFFAFNAAMTARYALVLVQTNGVATVPADCQAVGSKRKLTA